MKFCIGSYSLSRVVAGVVTIVNAANADADAAHTRGLRAESLESKDVPAVNVSAYVSIDEVEAFEPQSCLAGAVYPV